MVLSPQQFLAVLCTAFLVQQRLTDPAGLCWSSRFIKARKCFDGQLDGHISLFFEVRHVSRKVRLLCEAVSTRWRSIELGRIYACVIESVRLAAL
jgi:hypothetical protein